MLGYLVYGHGDTTFEIFLKGLYNPWGTFSQLNWGQSFEAEVQVSGFGTGFPNAVF